MLARWASKIGKIQKKQTRAEEGKLLKGYQPTVKGKEYSPGSQKARHPISLITRPEK